MNRTAPVLLLASLILHHTSPLAALAGGAVFVGDGSGSNVSTGVSVSSRHSRSTASIFIRVGNRWVPTPWHYYVAAPLSGTHYRTYEGQAKRRGRRGQVWSCDSAEKVPFQESGKNISLTEAL